MLAAKVGREQPCQPLVQVFCSNVMYVWKELPVRAIVACLTSWAVLCLMVWFRPCENRAENQAVRSCINQTSVVQALVTMGERETSGVQALVTRRAALQQPGVRFLTLSFDYKSASWSRRTSQAQEVICKRCVCWQTKKTLRLHRLPAAQLVAVPPRRLCAPG